VKAVWLPPPWQAIATLTGPVPVIRPMLRDRELAPLPAGHRAARHSGRELEGERGADRDHRDPADRPRHQLLDVGVFGPCTYLARCSPPAPHIRTWHRSRWALFGTGPAANPGQ
jgi:hypothetical protein